MTNQPDSEAIRKEIVDALDLGGMSEDEQEEIIEDFGRIALQASLLAVLETLSVEKREEFSALIEAGDEVALRAFVAKEVPEYDTISRKAVAEQVEKFKEFKKNNAS